MAIKKTKEASENALNKDEYVYPYQTTPPDGIPFWLEPDNDIGPLFNIDAPGYGKELFRKLHDRLGGRICL